MTRAKAVLENMELLEQALFDQKVEIVKLELAQIDSEINSLRYLKLVSDGMFRTRFSAGDLDAEIEKTLKLNAEEDLLATAEALARRKLIKEDELSLLIEQQEETR